MRRFLEGGPYSSKYGIVVENLYLTRVIPSEYLKVYLLSIGALIPYTYMFPHSQIKHDRMFPFNTQPPISVSRLSCARGYHR